MIDIERVKKRIKSHEGHSNVPYRCPSGYRSIGYGWNIDARGLPPDIQTYLDANGMIAASHSERLLLIAVMEAMSDCRDIWPAFESYVMARQEGLIDLVYNMGAEKVEKGFPRFTAAIMREDWITAANELKYADGKSRLSKWYRDVKPMRAEAVLALIRGE